MTQRNVASAEAYYKAMGDQDLAAWRGTCTLTFGWSRRWKN